MNELMQREMEEARQTAGVDEANDNRFKIQNLEQLSWAFRKVKAIEQAKEEKEELARKEIERIQEWLDDEKRSLDNNQEYFEGLIKEYAMNKRKEEKSFKTEKTPYGKVTMRKQQPQYVYDEEKLVNYLTASRRFDYIKTEVKPVKNDIKKAFEVKGNCLIDPETGEIIDGVTVEERPEKIEIKTE